MIPAPKNRSMPAKHNKLVTNRVNSLLPTRSHNQGSQPIYVKEYPEIGGPHPANSQESATPDLLGLVGGHSKFVTHRGREK